jgi:uncharacterized membrane protein
MLVMLQGYRETRTCSTLRRPAGGVSEVGVVGQAGAVESELPQTLVGIAFPDVFRAQEFFTATTRLSVNGQLQLKDAVFVTKDEQGRTMVKETADLQTIPTAASGAFWAGLFGALLGGPVGFLAGAAIGAGAGAITARAVDLGITDEWVQWFRDAVEPGNTILALLCENVDRQALTDELERFPNAHLVYANVDDSWLERMHQALGESITIQPAASGDDGNSPPESQT